MGTSRPQQLPQLVLLLLLGCAGVALAFLPTPIRTKGGVRSTGSATPLAPPAQPFSRRGQTTRKQHQPLESAVMEGAPSDIEDVLADAETMPGG